MWKVSANKSGRSRANSTSNASAGGQDEQLCDVNSSTTTGRSAACIGATAAISKARADSVWIAAMGIFLDDFRDSVKAGRHIFLGSRRKVTRRDRCSDSRGSSLGIAVGSRQRMAGGIAVARAGTAVAPRYLMLALP